MLFHIHMLFSHFTLKLFSVIFSYDPASYIRMTNDFPVTSYYCNRNLQIYILVSRDEINKAKGNMFVSEMDRFVYREDTMVFPQYSASMVFPQCIASNEIFCTGCHTWVICHERHLSQSNLAFYVRFVTNNPHDHLYKAQNILLEATYCGTATISSLICEINICCTEFIQSTYFSFSFFFFLLYRQKYSSSCQMKLKY